MYFSDSYELRQLEKLMLSSFCTALKVTVIGRRQWDRSVCSITLHECSKIS